MGHYSEPAGEVCSALQLSLLTYGPFCGSNGRDRGHEKERVCDPVPLDPPLSSHSV